MEEIKQIIFDKSIQEQKRLWRKQSWTMPELRGSKQTYFQLVIELIKQVKENQIIDLGLTPTIETIENVQIWKSYVPFLKGLGLAENQSGHYILSSLGNDLYNTKSPEVLANIIHERFRLYGECLLVVKENTPTIDEVNKILCSKYGLTWCNLSNIRKRMDWLEVLGLINVIGNRKWQISELGEKLLKEWILIDPNAIDTIEEEAENIVIPEAPLEIQSLLKNLETNPDLHKDRCTYNLWVPSPNRIENLRMIIQACTSRIQKNEMFKFICEEFNLRLSSVESMLPFLKASGLIQEVGRNIYITTTVANAWLETGNDLDFIRILHANMKCVGEIIKFAEEDVVRNDIYTYGKQFGMNNEKIRWIIGFLMEANLLEELQYLHIKTTGLGRQLLKELPLELLGKEESDKMEVVSDIKKENRIQNKLETLSKRLHVAAFDPTAEGKASGLAFEESIASIFNYIGFKSEHIGGSGDTDVVLRWEDVDGNNIVAIVDGKSKSSGQVSHGDISDVAIDTHKEKNAANFVIIIGPGFSGDTIKNFAKKKSYALITDQQLIEIAKATNELGLSLDEVSIAFKVPNGFSEFEDLVSKKTRELEIVTEIVKRFCVEQIQLGSLSPRDLFLLLRNTNSSPSLDELLVGFDTLSNSKIGVLNKVQNIDSTPENIRYNLYNTKKIVSYLRALANSIEKGM